MLLLRFKHWQGLGARRVRYRGQELGFGTQEVGGRAMAEIVDAVDRDGYVVLENVFAPQDLAGVTLELDQAIRGGRLLPVLRDTRAESKERFLTAEELSRGPEYISQNAFVAYVADPFMTCPSSQAYLFSDTIIDLAAAIYESPPLLVGGKVMRSFCNDLPLVEFNYFHYDSQSVRIIKFFLYLNDVAVDGGPFCYVSGSHRRKPPGWRTRSHWSDEEIEAFYGKQAVHQLAAKAGDLIIANTFGFHRAAKPASSRRDLLLVGTGAHSFGGSVRMSKADLSGLSPKQVAFADCAELV